ncbi:DUF2750 domain-containing protein [Thiobaca trueperi]|uniref:Uncharacterized protein DUF2750 n=1 Tax=Thiobaca trueperi TaxID=127458 RepID=A0A4V6P014_9GAMM|nr:DUF2750 domain-containing protein [Thiobaca trueperi]TCT24182.1 uncharacterized protein DUF2750 [Thiobaca trueperi]
MTAPHASSDAFSLPAPERYFLFVTEATAQGRVWALKGEGGFVAFRDDEGHECFPFWPAPALAEALADDDWSDCRAEPLTLDVFMDRWLTGMARDGRLVSVFPAPDGSAIVIDPLTLLQDLQEERGPGL